MKYRSRAYIAFFSIALFSGPSLADSYITHTEGNGGSSKDIYWYYLDKPVSGCASVKTQDRNINSVLRIAYLIQRPVALRLDRSGCAVTQARIATP
jgi:hypothetical protein